MSIGSTAIEVIVFLIGLILTAMGRKVGIQIGTIARSLRAMLFSVQ